MANMGLGELILVRPSASLGGEARALAVGAVGVLERATCCDSLSQALGPFSCVVGTTSTRVRRLEIPTLTPRELPRFLSAQSQSGRAALVFGPESSGLTNEELALCGAMVGIPAAPRQPTLNLSQAVLILTYELYLAHRTPPSVQQSLPAPVTNFELDGLFSHLEEAFHQIGFARDDSYAAVLRDLRTLTARASLTVREVRILRGILRRTLNTMARLGRSTSPG